MSNWFSELRTTVAASERWSLTYANADLASMQRNKANSAFEQSVTIARATTEQKLGFTTSGTFLFQDKYPIPESVIGLANSFGTRACQENSRDETVPTCPWYLVIIIYLILKASVNGQALPL